MERPHAKQEDNFLVGNRATATVQSDSGETSGALKAPPVSLITVSIPVQFQITDVRAWAYTNADPAGLLQELATREVVRFLAGVDLEDILSHGAFGRGAGIAGAAFNPQPMPAASA